MKKFLLPSGTVILITFICLQFFRPKIENPPVTKDLEAPRDVKNILIRACYDCHSNQTNLRWYDKIQPVYWQVVAHVRDGRKGLNFSNWDSLAPADQKAKLWEAVNQIASGAMPIKSYEFVHSDARVSHQDLLVLKNYLSSMAHGLPYNTAKINDRGNQWQSTTHHQVASPKTLNGITYIPDYKNWQIISLSDRFDNGTIRVIYGNDIAVKAVKEAHINPWPTGTTFAKVAWDKINDGKGDITAGAFKQVEFMIKDNEKFKTTDGWGFARFKTPKLIPYGKTAMFTTECIACHKPMANNDLVFTFPIKN